MVEFINFGSFGQATVGKMSSFVTLRTFKVSGGTLKVCAVSCITTSNADGWVYFWFLVLTFLHLLLLIGRFATISVTIVIATIFVLLALVQLLATHLVDGTLARSTSDVFCSHPA